MQQTTTNEILPIVILLFRCTSLYISGQIIVENSFSDVIILVANLSVISDGWVKILNINFWHILKKYIKYYLSMNIIYYLKWMI